MKTDQLSAWRQAHGHAALLSLGELCRRPVSSLLAWLIIAIALALPGVLALVLGNLKEMNVRWQGNIPTLSVYLQTQSSDDEAQLESEISHLPDVASFRKITPEEAMQQLQRVTQLTDLDQVLPHNPLPTVLVVRPRHSAVQQATLSALKDQLSGLNGVDFVQLDMRWVERLLAFLQIGERLTGYLAALLGLGVLLIVGNTIRLSLLRHQRDIDVLSLIGATAGFIRRPFLYRGFWLGLGGGFLACLILLLLQAYLHGAVGHLADLYGSTFRLKGLSWSSSLYLVFFSSILGVLGARIACWRVKPGVDVSTG